MRRTLVAAVGLVVVGCWVGMATGTAGHRGKPGLYRDLVRVRVPVPQHGCEMNYQRGSGSGIGDETYCQSDSPPQSVRMSTNGQFKTCTGTTVSAIQAKALRRSPTA